MTVNDAIELLIRENYMVSMKGKYTLTNNFHRNYIPVSESGLVVVKKEVAKIEANAQLVIPSQPILTVDQMFMQFIKDANVPTRCPTAKYWLNRFNKDAAKEFGRLLSKESINYSVLLASTKLYYIQTKEYAKTIGNYFIEGTWRTGYQDMIDAADKGNLGGYIQGEITPFGEDI